MALPGKLQVIAAGDADRNGRIESADLKALLDGFGQLDPTWATGDFNYDKVVDTIDFNLISSTIFVAMYDPSQIESGVPILHPSNGPSSIGVPTPEPAASMFACLAFAATILRRRGTHRRR